MKRYFFLFIFLNILTSFGCDKDYDKSVELIRYSQLTYDTSITIYEALEKYQYFTDFTWESYFNPDNQKIVRFKGFLKHESIEEDIRLAQELLTRKNAKDNTSELINALKNTHVAFINIQFLVSPDESRITIYDVKREAYDKLLRNVYIYQDTDDINMIYKNKRISLPFDSK
ncbi:hypothetical protein ACFL47_09460 [Candidatus Latescibacterota bacterium]